MRISNYPKFYNTKNVKDLKDLNNFHVECKFYKISLAHNFNSSNPFPTFSGLRFRPFPARRSYGSDFMRFPDVHGPRSNNVDPIRRKSGLMVPGNDRVPVPHRKSPVPGSHTSSTEALLREEREPEPEDPNRNLSGTLAHVVRTSPSERAGPNALRGVLLSRLLAGS